MAIQKRFKVEHGDVFPLGAFIKGRVQPVPDFNQPANENGDRPQQKDKETGLLIWQVVVVDADEDATKKDTALTVKFLAKVFPVLPDNKTPFPFTPVEFVGLSALPYIDDSGQGRARIAWSFRAEGMVEPGAAKTVKAAS